MILIIITCVIFLDQLSKYLATKLLYFNTPVSIIDNFLYLTLAHNRGAAFGLFKNQLLIFVLISIFAIVLIFFFLKAKNNSLLSRFALSMILGGAIGNLIDRLRFGYVIDFLDFRVWPVFNLADSAITIAALFLTWELFSKKNVT
ncbi:MAG: signal peptidase II [Candidatus Omnitrophota bacterium]